MPRTTKSKRSRPASSSSGPKQQQLSAMLGDRVKKPRHLVDGVIPPSKRQKLGTDSSEIQAAAVQPPKPPTKDGLTAQKRKYRLSEILKKERESRLQRTPVTPAFVFHAPHMDSRRPPNSPQTDGLPPKDAGKVKARGSKHVSFWGPDAKEKAKAVVRKASCLFNVTADNQGVRTHGAIVVPGGDALMYSRSMLPRSHLLLLDVLTGLESAISLLKTRKTLPTIAAIGQIIRRSTRRECNLKTISQLAHIVPEAVAVLPGLIGSAVSKRRSDNLIIRLDNIDDGRDAPTGKPLHDDFKVSKLGTSAARLRRSLLHKRLLRNVKENHSLFLKERGIKNYTREVWHSEFDLERDVDELPAPPLYPEMAPGKVKESPAPKPSEKQKQDVVAEKLTANTVRQNDDTLCTVIDENSESGEEDVDECIPTSLLKKVRARRKARQLHESNVEVEQTHNTSLLSKLPCTMDTICTVLRTERRSAMGWAQLLERVGKVHPKKWPRDDLDKQLEAITKLGVDWCKKVELKSSRGGYAFRVVSESSYAKARATICATTSYIVEDTKNS